jgi:nucleoside-diphosphate-sugar epimerase
MDIFITGGAGFIGCNSADHFLRQGHRVTIFDNLSRVGGPANLAWLQARHSDGLRFVQGDIRDYDALATAIAGADVVLHLASQVAVTLSVQDPRQDFEINALGTFNVLEAVRHYCPGAAVLYASTNKVYGGMDEVRIVEQPTRYAYADFPHGIPESYPLDFHSPYGCCYSEDTDVLTRKGWQRFQELEAEDEVLTYNLERQVAEFQRPTRHFAFAYEGKMYVQSHDRLQTCVTPNHKMLVAQGDNDREWENLSLEEARLIDGQPVAYLLAAEVEGGRKCEQFILAGVKAEPDAEPRPGVAIPMDDWLEFLGWYLAERDWDSSETTVSKQLYQSVRSLGGPHHRHIPPEIKALSRGQLTLLLGALLDDENLQSEGSWRFTTCSERLADDVQEIAVKCGLAASVAADDKGAYQVHIAASRTARCNADENRSRWVDYAGMVYCVEVPNATVMVRQNGHAYFSGNSKGAGDQYTIDYARIYGLNTLTLRQSCLAAGQEIITPFGKKPIACLQVGDVVHSGRGWTRVRQVWFTGAKPVRRLRTRNGLAITLTADHRVVRPHGLFANREFASGDFLAVLPEARYMPAWEEISDRIVEPEPFLAAVQARTADHRCLAEAERIANELLPLTGDRLLAMAEVVGRLFSNGRLDIKAWFKPTLQLDNGRRTIDDNWSERLWSIVYGPSSAICKDRLHWLVNHADINKVVSHQRDALQRVRTFNVERSTLNARENSEACAYMIQHFGSEDELQELKQHLAWLGLPAGDIVPGNSRSPSAGPGYVEGRSCRIGQESIPVFTLYELLGVPVGDKLQVAYPMPAWVAHGHGLVKRAFLRGFLGAALCPGDGSSEPYLAPSFAQTKDERAYESGRRWLEAVQTLLAEFEIESACLDGQPMSGTRGTTIETTVQLRAGREIFARLAAIGYAFSPARSDRLNRALREQWITTAPEQAAEIVRLHRADGELYWDALATVESLPEQPVFDLEVEADSHLLLAGGIQVSNCIYGQRQFGVEDQGWVAHFIIAAVNERPLTIYGDGKQVRDLLHVNDLIRAYELGIERMDHLKGEVINLGGGPQNTLSIWTEFEPLLESLRQRPLVIRQSGWRPGDQRVFVADIRKAEKLLGWQPTISPAEGIADLYQWVSTNPDLF